MMPACLIRLDHRGLSFVGQSLEGFHLALLDGGLGLVEQCAGLIPKFFCIQFITPSVD
jgi:hypothetical protein